MEKKISILSDIIDILMDLGKEFNKALYDLQSFLDYLIEESGEKL